MSWSLCLTGQPQALTNALAVEAGRLTGGSKSEFEAALPGMLTLINLNSSPEGQAPPLLTLTANGHASGGYSQCNVSLARVAGQFVTALLLGILLFVGSAAVAQDVKAAPKLPARVETNQLNPPVPYFAGGPGSLQAPAGEVCDACLTRGARVNGEPVRNIGRGAAKAGAGAVKVVTAPVRWILRRGRRCCG